jgi:hypothetical protein
MGREFYGPVRVGSNGRADLIEGTNEGLEQVPRDDIDRGGNETETCSPGDFENNRQQIRPTKEIVLTASPAEGA